MAGVFARGLLLFTALSYGCENFYTTKSVRANGLLSPRREWLTLVSGDYSLFWYMDGMSTPAPEWTTDAALFASLPGGQSVINWFGFCPDFHDCSLEKLELLSGNALLMIRSFRMTGRTDNNGRCILDRHAYVILRMRGVTGVKLEGEATSIISELVIRRLAEETSSDWETCAGPIAGNIEVSFGTSFGLCGAIYANELEFELQPRPEGAFV